MKIEEYDNMNVALMTAKTGLKVLHNYIHGYTYCLRNVTFDPERTILLIDEENKIIVFKEIAYKTNDKYYKYVFDYDAFCKSGSMNNPICYKIYKINKKGELI